MRLSVCGGKQRKNILEKPSARHNSILECFYRPFSEFDSVPLPANEFTKNRLPNINTAQERYRE